MQAVVDEIQAVLAEGSIPSASICVRVRGRTELLHTAGLARIEPRREATTGQVYDLASVTKPLAGATVAAAWLARGLRLDERVDRYVPGVDPRITVAMLLTHASGYPPWAPLYERIDRARWGTPEGRAEILELAQRTPLAHVPGEAHAYSDLGFLVLLSLLEALGGPLEAQLAPLLVAPMSWGTPAGVAAATEDCPVRGRVIDGEVHDLNAFAMGGVSTHAGLFASSEAVALQAEALLAASRGERDDVPDPSPLWACRGPGSHRGGWDGVTVGAYTSTGSSWPVDGVGHLGYTGTSVWIAPREQVVVALSTNRVHPVDDKAPIRAARPRIHDAVARTLGLGRTP
ncbi:MAG: beta-lactamase family protein [Alphaproteobacteria bacterium]|nr:beta-lactamase family protein [Alphaproteobacteria bacterium]